MAVRAGAAPEHPAPSAGAFVPFLIELIALPKQPARWELLSLLGELACGGDHVPYLMTGYTGDDPLQTAVALGHDHYVAALHDRSASTRSAAAFVLAWLPTHAGASRKELAARLARERDATAPASMLLSLAVLGDTKPATAALADESPVVRGAALSVLARKGSLTKKAKELAAELVTARDVDALCWRRGQLGTLVLDAVLGCGDLPDQPDVLRGRSPRHAEGPGVDVPFGDPVAARRTRACGDDVVPAVRTFDFNQHVQDEGGALIVATSTALPALLVLARRDPALPDARLEAMSNTLTFSRVQEVEWYGALALDILRALRPAQRGELLAKWYRNTPPWVTSGKLLLERAMVDVPSPELTACLLQRVKELADDYAYGRKYGGSLFGEAHDKGQLKAMSPADHPLTDKLTEHLEAYARAADAQALHKALAKFRAM